MDNVYFRIGVDHFFQVKPIMRLWSVRACVYFTRKFTMMGFSCLKLSLVPFVNVADINECLNKASSVCPANSLCGDTDGSYTCKCQPGFEGDGRTCTGKFPLFCLRDTWM